VKRVKRMWVLEILLRLVRVQDLETEIPWFLFLKQKYVFYFNVVAFLMKGRLINYYIFLRKKMLIK